MVIRRFCPITHDLGVVAGHCDRVAVMYAGRIVETGTVDDIFYTPRMPYTLGLLGSLPRMDREEERLTPITGSPPSLLNLPPGCPFAPRCPLRRDLCDRTEPALRPAGHHPLHLSACHFTDELAGTGAAEVFDAAGADSAALARFADTTASGNAEEDPV